MTDVEIQDSSEQSASVARDLTDQERAELELRAQAPATPASDTAPLTQARAPEDFDPNLYRPAKKVEIQNDVLVLEQLLDERARSLFSLAEVQLVYGFMPRLFGAQWPAGVTERAKMAAEIVNELAGRVLEKVGPGWGFLSEEVREITITAVLKQWLGKQVE